MHVIGLIPARMGSKGVANKNILPLGGHPLLAYSVAASCLASGIHRTVITTDSAEYADIARLYGAEAPFLRPADISGDMALDNAFFAHFYDYLSQQGQPIPDLVVHLRPTSPLRDPQVIDAAVRFLQAHPEVSSVRSAHETHLVPHKLARLEGEYLKPYLDWDGEEKEFYNLPRQVFEPCYIPNGYVDVLRPYVFLETGLLHGERAKYWQTDPVPDVDDLHELAIAGSRAEDPDLSVLRQYLDDRKSAQASSPSVS